MVKRIEIVVGAAIGLGMTARAAADGGADFLLVLSAGRLRVMGAPSLAAMLPIRDSNSFTDAFARREILDRVAPRSSSGPPPATRASRSRRC